MRTPGDDEALALGYLFTEGIIATTDDVEQVRACAAPNVIRVDLRPDKSLALQRLARHSFTSSSCGVCGKKSIQAIHVLGHAPAPVERPEVDAEIVSRLPANLRKHQEVFARTGGLHAAALFASDGRFLCLREDVGRHNALDKLIGAQFQAGQLPLSQHMLLLSGRASFELVQKAAAAGIGIVAAVGAPSSLAVDLAMKCGMTLLGFVREDGFNVYTGAEQLGLGGRSAASIANAFQLATSGDEELSKPEAPSSAL
jgi:FdhD protein